MSSATNRSPVLWFVCAIALVVGLAVRADAAAAVRIVVPAGGERLVAGQLVEVHWANGAEAYVTPSTSGRSRARPMIRSR